MKTYLGSFLFLVILAVPSLSAIWEDFLEGPMQPADRWDMGWARQGTYLGPPEEGRANFVDRIAGLEPTVGGAFFSGFRGTEEEGGQRTQVGVKHYLPFHQFQPGVYTLTFDVGLGEGWTFQSPLVLLVAETEGNSRYDWSKRISAERLVIFDSAPPEVGWETWTVQYEIGNSTINQRGDQVVGSNMGIVIIAQVAPGEGFAVDNMRISFDPSGEAAAQPQARPQTTPERTATASDPRILISWDSGRWRTFAQVAEGINGYTIVRNPLEGVGSMDGRFGSEIAGADDQIKWSASLTAEEPFVIIRLENESARPVNLTGIHFDAARLDPQSMTSLRLLHWEGLDIPPAHILYENNSLPLVADRAVPWHTIDVDLTGYHHQVAPRESVVFHIVSAGGPEPIAVDNIAITGHFEHGAPTPRQSPRQSLMEAKNNEPEILYNGIVLPRDWPPRTVSAANDDPMEFPIWKILPK